MSGPKLDNWQAGSMAKTVNVHTPDFQADIELLPSTVNVTSGINEGIGPRYGFAPIPGHSDTEAVSGAQQPGMMLAELGYGATSLSLRQKIMGIIPIRYAGPNASISTIGTAYILVLGYGYNDGNHNGKTYLDAQFLGSQPFALPYQQNFNITDGLLDSALGTALGNGRVGLLNLLTQVQTSDSLATLTDITGVNHVSSAPFTVTGIDVAAPWLVGQAGDIAKAVKIAFQGVVVPGAGALMNDGIPPEFNYGNFPTAQRTVLVYTLTSSAHLNSAYKYTFIPTTSIFIPSYSEFAASTNIDLSTLTPTTITTGTPANTTMAVYNDPSINVNSSYKGTLVASAGKAIMVMFQDWYRNVAGTAQQYVDLVNLPYEPVSMDSAYTEAGTQVKTAFCTWPNFVRGTAMVTDASLKIALGAAGSGLLRATTSYEFSYSVYDKRLDYETNVGIPVKFMTGTNDNVCLQLFDTATVGAGTTMIEQAGAEHILPFPAPVGTVVSSPATLYPYLNYLEYRFYYRQEGMTEWLPALFIDAVEWWFSPFNNALSACTGGIGGLVGGRPGGFADYSRLPQDNYTCVLMHKGRAFWLSDKACCFSLQNNLFAYPTSNTISAPSGSFKGAIEQAYYGQATQDSRIVIFATDATYVGKFTGVPQQVPVQVSPTSVGTYPLDGSDFVINAWTSITAFSYRSAVVAEGLLYFWGPQGIFLDDGVNPIQRISIPLEPDLFNYYNASQTDQIFAVYNDTTKEITWFYPPQTADSTYPTYGIVFNRIRSTWLFTKYGGQIDDADNVRIDQNIPTAGSRVVTFARATASSTIQRAYYYDHNNKSGDISPKRELMVKAISTPSAGHRRLTLAAGYDATNFATIAAGDFIALNQVARYATSLATPADMLAQVTATGTGTIDIALPVVNGVTINIDTSATLSPNYDFMPIWHMAKAGNGINGFPYVIATKYWMPASMAYWAYWLYLHLVFKTNYMLPSTNALTTALTYQTPISGTSETDILTFSNNSDQNCQVFHPMQVGNQSIEGQALRFQLNGIQIGSAWVLQFIQAFVNAVPGLQLKHFEG